MTIPTQTGLLREKVKRDIGAEEREGRRIAAVE